MLWLLVDWFWLVFGVFGGIVFVWLVDDDLVNLLVNGGWLDIFLLVVEFVINWEVDFDGVVG